MKKLLISVTLLLCFSSAMADSGALAATDTRHNFTHQNLSHPIDTSMSDAHAVPGMIANNPRDSRIWDQFCIVVGGSTYCFL